MTDITLSLAMAVGGLLLLALGGEWLVRGAVTLSRRLGLSAAFIGMSVVALGTTAPEMFVSVQAALRNAPDIAVGNVVGSNIANVLLILGIAAAIGPIAVNPRAIRLEGVALLVASTVLMVLGYRGEIGRAVGLLLVAGLVAFMVYSYRADVRANAAARTLHEREGAEAPGVAGSTARSAGLLLVGLALLPVGAHLLIEGAVTIAHNLGVSEAVIGVTLVAVGTSLPELATAIVASIRRHADVALGNIVGANIYNIGLILGLAGLARPLVIAPKFVAFDLWVMLAAVAALLALLLGWRGLGRPAGAAMLLAFAAYVAAQFLDMVPVGPTP